MIIGVLVALVLLGVVVAAVRRQPSSAGPGPAPGVLPPAGWYPDPWHQAPSRWWDGHTWTGSVSASMPPAPPRPPRPRAAPLPGPALSWAVTTVVVAAAVVVAFTWFYRHVARPPVVPGLLLFYACLYGTLFGSCTLFSMRHGSGSLAADYGLDLRLRDSYRGLGVYLLANIASAIAVAPFLHTSRFQGTNTQSLTDYRDEVAVYLTLALIAVVAAPFFEELFFRGMLFRALLGRVPWGWAVVAQALVFGSAHYNPYIGSHNVSVIVAITAMGVVLGWSAMYFRRLGPGMVAHFLKNLTAVLAILAT